MESGPTGTRTALPRSLDHMGTWTRNHVLVVDTVIAMALAGLLAPWSIEALYAVDSEPALGGAPATHALWAPIVTAAILIGHGSLALRRIRPLTSFILVSASVGVQIASSWWWVLPSVFVFLLSLYSYSAYGRPSAPACSIIVGFVGTVLVTVLGAAVAPGATGVGDLAFHVLVRDLPFIVAAWSLGLFRRVRQDYVAALEERAVRAETDREQRARRAVIEERTRIAREMHDVVAHAWSVVISQAHGGRYAGRTDPDQAMESLATIAETGRQALTDMRSLLAVLRDEATDTDQSQQHPQPALSDLPELVARVRESGVTVTFTEQGNPQPLGTVGELAVYRLVQEALTNTLKHAGAHAAVDVCLYWSSDGLNLLVHDNGPGNAPSGGGRGLIGMRERIAIVGGNVTAGPDPSGGFCIQAHVPKMANAHSDVTASVTIAAGRTWKGMA